MKILFVGNSYTYFNDLPKLFEKIANENGKNLSAASVTRGGRQLCQHAESGDECTQKLERIVEDGEKYDLAVLQEQSILPIVDFDKFLFGAKALKEKLSCVADGFLLYSTWGRKDGNATLEEYSWTHESMTKDLAEAYKRAGEQLEIPVSYVGLNFSEIYRNHEDVELYNPDKTHPSYKGTALAALTIYNTVFGELPKMCESLELSDFEKQLFLETVEKQMHP